MRRAALVISVLFLTLAGCSGGSQTSQAPSAAPTSEATAASPASPAPPVSATATGEPAATAASSTPAGPSAAATTAAPAPTAAAPAARATVAPQPADQPAGPLPSGVSLQPVAEGLTSPVALVAAPDDSGRLFVVDQAGVIRIIGSDGKLLPDPFLDVRDRMVKVNGSYDERGLLGLAFDPDFANNKRFFVYYTAPLRQGGPAGFDNTEHLSAYAVSGSDPNKADPASERVILQIDHPQPNHNGGTLAFGPDGFLYLSIGDGGGANDSGNGHTPGTGNAQDTSNLLGKILRIDVNSGEKYGIPKDNPFAAGGGAPEIYAYGLRNAYRFSFDKGGSHELFAADVGQNLYEEIDIITRGGNYGWHLKEGMHCFDASNPSRPPASCAATGARGEPLVDPILEYRHPDPGIAVVGGFVYRGSAVPALAGRYVFGDWSSSFGAPDGVLLVAQRPAGGQGQWQWQKLATGGGRLGHYLLGIGQDNAGELYVLTTDRPGPAGNTGRVFKIVP